MKVSTIEEYLNNLNETEHKYVNDFICFMRQEYPNIAPIISFSMPMWLAGNKMNEGYVAISVAKKHVSIHFSEEACILELKKLLPERKTGKQCINIPYEKEEEYEIVKQNVKRLFQKK